MILTFLLGLPPVSQRRVADDIAFLSRLGFIASNGMVGSDSSPSGKRSVYLLIQ